jgi:hypothetical protein
MCIAVCIARTSVNNAGSARYFRVVRYLGVTDECVSIRADHFRFACRLGITDRRASIRDLPIEGVDFLGAGVAEQKRRVVGPS